MFLFRVRYHINKDKGDKSQPLLAFLRHIINITFQKYSKEGRFSSSHLGIGNIPSHVCYDDTKHYKVQSEYRRIQKPFKRLRVHVLGQAVNS